MLTDIIFTKLPDRPTDGVVRLVHTADNHLRVSASGSLARGEDFYKAAESVISIAVHRGACAVINAGDLFNAADNPPVLMEQLTRLDELARSHALPVLCIQGNHDYAQPSWVQVLQQSRGNDTRIGGFMDVDNKAASVRGLPVWCMPYKAPADLRASLASPTPEQAACKIVVWHGQVLEFANYPSENIVTVEDFDPARFNLVLLGDIHLCKYLQKDGMTIGYPGATELCKSDEPLTHSCTIIDIEQATGRVLGMETAPVAHREVLTFRVDNEVNLADAVAAIRGRSGKELMVLVKFNDAVPEVRSRLQAACGVNGIVRAERYTLGVVIQKAEQRGTRKGPVDYLPDLVSDTLLLRTCQQLCMPDINVQETLRSHTALVTNENP